MGYIRRSQNGHLGDKAFWIHDFYHDVSSLILYDSPLELKIMNLADNRYLLNARILVKRNYVFN